MNEKIEAGDLSDAVRIPLHELQADVDYLIGRVVADGSCAPMIATSIKTKLAALESALPPLRAREEIARALENAALFLEIGARYAPNEVVDQRIIATKERLKLRGLADVMRAVAEDCRALSRTAGQEWRDRIGEALLPFGLLARRYDHHKAPDDEIVRSHGTLGKPGDRGYTHITVSDLRRAAALLDELAAAEPIVAEKREVK